MSRRQEVLRMKSSSYMNSRDRQYDTNHHDMSDMGSHRVNSREELSYRSRRSLSPPYVVEDTRRAVRRSISLERRRDGDYVQNIDRFHNDYVISRPIPIENALKRPHLDKRAVKLSPELMDVRREYEHPENPDYNNISRRSQNPYDYVGSVKEKDYGERRSGASGHTSLVQRSFPVEDILDKEDWPCPNYGYPSKYGEDSAIYSRVDVHRFKDDSAQTNNSVPHDKLSKDMYYKEGNRSAYYSRESPYLDSPLVQPKDFRNEDLLKHVQSSSSGLSKRGGYLRFPSDVHTVPSNAYPEGYEEVGEPLMSDDYGQRLLLESRGGYSAEIRHSKCYECDVCTSSKAEQKGYMYPEVGHRANDDFSFVQGNSYRKMAYIPAQHDHRGLSGPDNVDTTMERIGKAEDPYYSRKPTKDSGIQELGIACEGMVSDYVDTRIPSHPLKKAEDYLDYSYTQSESAKKISNHPNVSEYSGFDEREIQDPYSGYGYGRYGPAGSTRVREKRTPELIHDMEPERFEGGSERINAEGSVIYDRGLKRKYSIDDDVRWVDSSSSIPSKWNTKRPSRYEQNHHYVEKEETDDDGYHHKDSKNACWTSYHIEGHSRKPSVSSGRHFKGHAKSENCKGYSHAHHSHQRNNHDKQHNVRQRGEVENHMPRQAQNVYLSDDNRDPCKSEPLESEETEEFKKRVQEAFLDFSKRIVENPTARKLYKEQGKAGSLFCIVCRRSASKEFLDTRALASHAFMSHKACLRSQHLGLHKAICVLMGWNILPDPVTGFWIPEALPKAEALAQKEDLILWPPVVIIHNISLSYNDHNKWKLINIDAVEEFLRVMGFNLGKMRICLGNPGDHSVILVKFVNTFSGLHEAERLHKSFLNKKHGRADFELATSCIAKGIDSKQEGNEDKKSNDVLLYGYMGVVDDVDRVDFDTKKKSLLKSKKEIHDLADGPVKPD